MSYIEAKLWWAGFMVLLAFIWGFFCESTGRELNGQKKRQ